MRRRPLIAICLAFGTGVLLAGLFPQAIWTLALGALIAFVFGVWRRRPALQWTAVLALAAWLGAMRCEIALTIPASDISRLPATTLVLTGKVDNDVETADDPHTEEPTAAFFVLHAVSVRQEGFNGQFASVRPVTGNVAVRVSIRSRVTHRALPPESIPQSGDLLELHGRLELPDGPRNPGAFDYRAYLARKGVYSLFTVRQPEQLRILARNGVQTPFAALAFGLRRQMQRAAHTLLSPDQAALFTGILLGSHKEMNAATQETFERTGTAHILATAGLHVGMAAWLLSRFLRFCRIPRRPAIGAALFFLVVYAMMAGERTAVLRAVIVASVCLVGELLEREPDIPNALALAALAVLVASPLELFSAGFQLSFCTVITILFVMPLARLWGGRAENGPHLDAARSSSPAAAGQAVHSAVRHAVSLAFLSVAAQLGSGPLAAFYFYNISLVSLPANLLIVPIVFGVIALGFPLCALFAIFPPAAVPVAIVVRLLLSGIAGCAEFLSDVPSASWNVAPPSPISVALIYCVLWLGAWTLQKWPGWRHEDRPRREITRLLAFTCAACGTALAWNLFLPRTRELRLTFLDVGQGDACVIETPAGRVAVVDTGGVLHEGVDNQGRRVVAPYLRYRGINAVDAIVLSHPHADHIGGAETVLRRFGVARLLDNGADTGEPLVPRYLTAAHQQNTQVVPARRGQTLDFGDGVTAQILAPTETATQGPINDASVVLRVRYGRTSFLLTGDAEAGEEADVLSAEQNVSCDVLKAGHHGSRTSSTPDFVSAAHPRIAVISVGKRNLYGHPSMEVLERFRENGVQALRTDQNGAVTCHSDSVTVHVDTMTGQ